MTFSVQHKKTRRFINFEPPPQKKSSASQVGGGHWGMRSLDKIMILQLVKPTIQHLGVRYANRPQKGGMW